MSYSIQEYYDSNLNKHSLICLENNKIISHTRSYRNPTISKYIVSSQYLQNISKYFEHKLLKINKTVPYNGKRPLSTELIKYEDNNKLLNLKLHFENNVESVMCKNYISIGNKVG